MTQDSSSASTRPQAKPPHPRVIINVGCKNNSIEEVARGLRLASSPDAYRDLVRRALFTAVYHGSAPVTEYLITQENAPLHTLSPLTVATSPSTELFSVLVSHGWDINQRRADHGAGRGQRLLDLICSDEALVRWCLEHGASVEDDPDADWYTAPPLLETAAAVGTLSTFKLLRERGAQLGRRTLHKAVSGAAHSKDSMEIVKYLVDELGMDVNQMDTDGKLPDHWGPPLCYAAKWRDGGEEVVRFLLERGADPTIKDCCGNHDAFSLAEFTKNEGVMKVLREWREQREQKEQKQGG
ncbi:hypothetical protein VTN96DRAFT_6941 [Rasamsonia emersonii]|uniref:Uncharacterized protein n=1 Tax=Rasamsonia emersonii (strain ATCC 16479 / CBS 393.64 / IMI 116815) TaxID=1408163 RepID=A0A0F4YLQ4_RASE3|nr:hypothetical protein T310_7253 [Rasamsonia emersonii CBS 393.64]KKA18786.1 hypothetical protein T310_7253 [Rasamsonia emersonii CBS 393.64]